MASPPAAAEAAAAASAGCGWGRTEGTPGLSSPLDSLRFQELASSMGRVLADSGLIDHHTHNTDRCAGEEGAAMAATGAPYPLVSSVLTMLLQLRPSDIGEIFAVDLITRPQ